MTSGQSNRPATPGRRWLRFSLKTVFVLVTLYCIWLAGVTIRAREQQRAILRIQELHGVVAFAFELDPKGNWHDKPQQFVPAWIRNALGEDYFRRAIVASFEQSSNLADDDLRVLANLPYL